MLKTQFTCHFKSVLICDLNSKNQIFEMKTCLALFVLFAVCSVNLAAVSRIANTKHKGKFQTIFLKLLFIINLYFCFYYL